MQPVEMQPVVVTTDKDNRGVFFGYVPPDADISAETITLQRCRMVVRWPAEQHGVGGLAAWGPREGARIGPAVPQWLLHCVTSVMNCTADAVAAFEDEPWSA